MRRTDRAPRLLAEWEQQDGVLMAWPHRGGDWGEGLSRVETTYQMMAESVTRFEDLLVVCADAEHLRHVQALLANTRARPDRVRFFCAPTNDVWTRDYGPLTVVRGTELELLDFRFDGWGGKHAGSHDDRVTRRLASAGAFGHRPLQSLPLILEGGSIECDGSGTLLTTARCLLSRGQGRTRAAMESDLRELLGAQRVLWIERGRLEGDDTDGHVDMLARFCSADTIAHIACDDPDDPHYPELAAMADELSHLRTADDQPYRLVPLPWPRARHNAVGQRLPLSYSNFLILNGAVLVPIYEDRRDEEALETLTPCFPDREIIPIPALDLVMQSGAVHCATLQLPAGCLG